MFLCPQSKFLLAQAVVARKDCLMGFHNNGGLGGIEYPTVNFSKISKILHLKMRFETIKRHIENLELQ